jgi:hypothetical protein
MTVLAGSAGEALTVAVSELQTEGHDVLELGATAHPMSIAAITPVRHLSFLSRS